MLTCVQPLASPRRRHVHLVLVVLQSEPAAPLLALTGMCNHACDKSAVCDTCGAAARAHTRPLWAPRIPGRCLMPVSGTLQRITIYLTVPAEYRKACIEKIIKVVEV